MSLNDTEKVLLQEIPKNLLDMA